MRESQLKSVATKFGTPVYVYDQSVIEHQCRELKKSFPGVSIHYACKANTNPTILKVIRKEGVGIETVSPGELRAAKAAGFLPKNISFTGASVTPEELRYAAKSGARVHLDSLIQLETWGKLKLGKEVSLRLNQGVGSGHHEHTITGGVHSKFGISPKDFGAARRIAKKYGLTITGIQQHIGSGILNAKLFLEGVNALLKATKDFHDLKYVDFGGGLGIPYRPTQRAWDLPKLGKSFMKLTKEFEKKYGRPLQFSLEPGRYIIAESGTLLVSVVDRKSTAKHDFVGVNSGFNHLIRPAMYGSYHEIVNVSRTKGVKKNVSIAGNVCESGDVFAHDRSIVSPKLGDVLAIKCAGAYGMTMASNYNMRALPKEIVVKGKTTKNISYSPTTYAF